MIAFDFDARDGLRFDNELRLPEVEHVLAICSGLVSTNTIILTHEDGSVKGKIRGLHLAHFSVKELLLSYYLAPSPRTIFGLTALEDWSSLFAQCCLVYLNQLTSQLSHTALLDFPAARYAAQNWIFFAQSSPSEYRPAIEELAFQLLHSSAVVYRNWICLYDHDMPWKGVDFSRRDFPDPIYILCFRHWAGGSCQQFSVSLPSISSYLYKPLGYLVLELMELLVRLRKIPTLLAAFLDLL